MTRYLREVDLVCSNFYGEESRALYRETACMLYSLEKLIFKKIESKVHKIVISLRPVNILSELKIPSVLHDEDSKILILERGFDLDAYFSITDFNSRLDFVYELIYQELTQLPKDIGVEILKIEGCLSKLRENGYIYNEIIGKPVSNSSKTLTAQLHVIFDTKEIVLGATLVDVITKKEQNLVIGRFDPFDSVLDQLGGIMFFDDSTLIYKPKRYFESIVKKIIE